MNNYQSISNELGLDNGFFSTRITTLNKLITSENRLSESFTFNLQQVAHTKFKDYIDFGEMEKPTKALAEILFSGESINKRGDTAPLLEVEMDIGFVGNPNIGSVVLNQFKDSDEFIEFASNFDENDRVFIISSIFGGTGAAGFPVILKNIRDAMNNKKIQGKGFLKNAKIGALTVLPYFNIEKDEDSPIQKSDFIAKTKSALHYYKNNVTGNNSVNALYYISDNYSGKPYKNDPGENGQQNDAHFIELASALAVIDFLELRDENLDSVDGRATHPIYKEFGIKRDASEIKFSDFEDQTQRKLSLRLSQLVLFKKYLDERLALSIEKEPWSTRPPALDKQFLDDSFYRTNIEEFMTSFNEWLKEMSENRRSFAPFNLDSSLEALIKDKTVPSGFFSRSKIDYAFYDSQLSLHSKGKSYRSARQKFVNLFFEATEKILISKYGLQQ